MKCACVQSVNSKWSHPFGELKMSTLFRAKLLWTLAQFGNVWHKILASMHRTRTWSHVVLFNCSGKIRIIEVKSVIIYSSPISVIIYCSLTVHCCQIIHTHPLCLCAYIQSEMYIYIHTCMYVCMCGCLCVCIFIAASIYLICCRYLHVRKKIYITLLSHLK